MTPNVWVSALLNRQGSPRRVLLLLRSGGFVLVSSLPLLAELRDVLGRPRLQRFGLTPEEAAELLELLHEAGVMADLSDTAPPGICRGPDDDILISTAEVGGANVLVSGDRDLHAAEVTEYLAERGIQVLTPNEFIAAFDPEPSAPGRPSAP